MILIDSSSWIEALRESGKAEVRKRVEGLLAAGNAAWCDPVRLELWNGARGQQERKALAQLEKTVPLLPVDDAVWDQAVRLAKSARDAGVTVPAVDLIIVACARRHAVDLEHNDRHLTRLQSL
jgi:hypothetical protein